MEGLIICLYVCLFVCVCDIWGGVFMQMINCRRQRESSKHTTARTVWWWPNTWCACSCYESIERMLGSDRLQRARKRGKNTVYYWQAINPEKAHESVGHLLYIPIALMCSCRCLITSHKWHILRQVCFDIDISNWLISVHINKLGMMGYIPLKVINYACVLFYLFGPTNNCKQ